MPSRPLTYRIDAADRLTSVSPGWDDFALANDGAAATSEFVLGRPLWDFISDVTTAALYRKVLQRIRSGRAMTYAFRCDSPACRRLMEMQIRLLDDTGAVEFCSTTLQEVQRALPPTAQADRSARADDEAPIRVCGWCNRFDVAGAWLEMEDALPRLQLMEYPDARMMTHGICEDCLEQMTGALASEG